jgi:hypothetical protein
MTEPRKHGAIQRKIRPKARAQIDVTFVPTVATRVLTIRSMATITALEPVDQVTLYSMAAFELGPNSVGYYINKPR